MISLGLMSGTSMDGIDAALIETDGEFNIKRLAHESLSYGNLSKSEILEQTTLLHADLIAKLLLNTKNKIDIIGYHGQTTYHNPAEKKSIQIGDPQYLANKFKLPVVFNFRQNDIDHGGQGAPLAPLYHQALMIQAGLDNMAVVNIGGIANISILTKNKILAGFDPGPGNILIDKFVQAKSDQKYDQDGQFAKQGQIDQKVLDVLFEQTIPGYYEKNPPKSLDINNIIYPEILNSLNLHDGCATLAAFTAKIIAKDIPRTIKHIVICGGGANNPAILNSLKNYLPDCSIKTADSMGWSNTYMEAELMAWLAVRSVKKLPLSLPETTGVSEPVTGGEIFYPKS
ncbi:MAG TPA: anhydro-N-acetylmuramic acid kinase [Gammaproteobacteria bacterium]|nr:anhydro-N-acetylmuramic acid kinase [Gammaproteobacteria bacterium]